MYATKRRKRSCNAVKRQNNVGGDQQVAGSNPSKRHRERLNMELNRLANLLPFDFQTIAKLDKLSILRLAVSYLRSKRYFQNSMSHIHHPNIIPSSCFYDFHGNDHHHHHHHNGDQELILQALNGFLMVVTDDGEMFYVSETVEQYLGFQQADIIHQSILDLIHSEDRNEFRKNLRTRRGSKVNFMVRFRCLLSNASGFVVFEVSGKLKVIQGSIGGIPNHAMFVLCSPFATMATTHVNDSQSTSFKCKLKMDMKFVDLDPKSSMLLKFTSDELNSLSIYKLIHPLDVQYFSATHDQLMKTGQSSVIAYRLLSKDLETLWFQSECKVMYKNGRPDNIEMLSRLLKDDEGESLCCKRIQQQPALLANAHRHNSSFMNDFTSWTTTTSSNNHDNDNQIILPSNFLSSSNEVGIRVPIITSMNSSLINNSNKQSHRSILNIIDYYNTRPQHHHHHHHHQQQQQYLSIEERNHSECSYLNPQKVYDDGVDPTFDPTWFYGYHDDASVARSSVIHFTVPNKFLPMLEL